MTELEASMTTTDRAMTFLEELVPPGGKIEPRDAEKAASAAGLTKKHLQVGRRRLGWNVVSEGGFNRPKRWYWIRPAVVDDAVVDTSSNVSSTGPDHYDNDVARPFGVDPDAFRVAKPNVGGTWAAVAPKSYEQCHECALPSEWRYTIGNRQFFFCDLHVPDRTIPWDPPPRDSGEQP